MSEQKKMFYSDVIKIIIVVVSCTVSYCASTNKSDLALSLALENKAFGMAREKKIEQAKEYARDYSYRKNVETLKHVKENTESIHLIREEMVETRVKLSHIEKNGDKLLELFSEYIIKNKTGL
jgi:hypothetical protein